MRNEAGPPNVIMPNVKHHRLFWRVVAVDRCPQGKPKKEGCSKFLAHSPTEAVAAAQGEQS